MDTLNSNDNTKPTAAELRRRFPSIPATATDDEVLSRYDAHIKTSEPAPSVPAPPRIERPSFESILKPTAAPASSTQVGETPNTYNQSLGHELAGVAKGAGKMIVNLPGEIAKDVASIPRVPIDLVRSLNAEGKLDDLPEVDYTTLRKLGLSHEAAKANVQAYITELEKRSGDLQKKAAKGQEQSTRAAAAALSTAAGLGAGKLLAKPMVAGAIERVVGGTVAKGAVKGAVEGSIAGGTYGGVSAAGQEKSLDEIVKDTAAASLMGAGLGGTFGVVGGKLKSRKEARIAVEAERKAQEALAATQAEQAAAERAAVEQAATAQAAEQAAAVEAAKPRPIDLATSHRAEVGFVQAVKQSAKEHGMDSDDLLKLVTKDDLTIQDLANAHQKHGLMADEIGALREGMPKPIEGVPSAAPVSRAVEQGPSLATPLQRQPIPQGALLPRKLAGALPMWKRSLLKFESDVDKAAYIVSQPKKSLHDAAYRQWLRGRGLSATEIAARGRVVKASISRAAAEAASGETIGVPSHDVMPNAAVEGTPAGASAAPAAPIAPPARATRAPGEFAPTSRAEMLPTDTYRGVVRKIEASPSYLDKLNESGGGRRITNATTWEKAVKAPPMTLDELGSWKPSDRVNEVDVARARIFRQATLDEHQAALASGDLEALDRATSRLLDVEAGFNNLTATPGRALQMEGALLPGVEERLAVSEYQREYLAAVHELRAAKIPYDQFANKLEEIKRRHAITDSGNGAIQGVTNSLETWATAAKLTSPVTHAINTISNGLTHVLQRGPEKFIASRILKAGGRTAEAEALAKNALWASSQGFKDATRIALEEARLRWEGKLAKSIPTQDPKIAKLQAAIREMQDAGADEGSIKAMHADLEGLMMSKAEVASRKLPLKMEKVFSALDAADTYWKTITYHSEINQRALAQALSEGLKGEGLAARTKWLMEQAPETWVEEAWTKAKEMTFQEDSDKFLKAMQGIQRLPGGRVVFAAFLKTPYNIIRFAVRRSPLGLLSPQLRKDIAAGGVRAAEAKARVGLGTAMSLGMVGLAYQGQFTGAYPKDVNERKRWEAAGIKPWSMKLGDRWINYARFGPLSVQMMLAAGYVQALKDGKKDDASALYIRLFQQYVRGPLELPMMQSTSMLIGALEDPEHAGEKFVQGMATGFVPNVLRDVRQQTDTVRRKPEGIGQAIEDMLPGVSSQVPARLDVLGREAKLDPNSVLRATKLVSKSTEDEVTKAMIETGYVPPAPQPTLSWRDTKIKLEGKEKEEYFRDMGAAVEAAMRTVMAFPAYKDWSNEERATHFERLVSKRRESMTKIWKSRVGVLGENRKIDPKTFKLRHDSLLGIKGVGAPTFGGMEPDEVVGIVAALRKLYPIPASAPDAEVLRRHKAIVAGDLSDAEYAAKAKATYLPETPTE